MKRLLEGGEPAVTSTESSKRFVARRPLRIGELDRRHARILQLLALDAPVSAIAAELYLTPYGVKYHIDRLRALFGVKSQAALVAAAFVAGVLATGDGTIQVPGLDDLIGTSTEVG